MKWTSGVNIGGEPYIYDKTGAKQFWLNSEHYLIACILNHYEEEIDKLESHINYNNYPQIPTVFEEMMDGVVSEMKLKMNRMIIPKLKEGDGWEVKCHQKIDDEKYEVTLKIERIR